MRGAKRRLLVACLALAAAAPVRAQRQAPPVFRTDVQLVVQTVSVTDRQGRSIEGLTARDFVVTEDREVQEIAFVEYQRLADIGAEPGAAAAARTDERPAAVLPDPAAAVPRSDVPPAVETGIAAPAAGDARFRDRRLIVLYFDLSATAPADQFRVYRAALQYIDADMQPSDLLAVMTFGGGAVRVRQDFTDNRAALREVIGVLMYGKDEDGDGLPDPEVEGTEFGQNDAEFNVFSTDRQLAALQTAVSMLRPFPERKSLVYFASYLRLNGTDNQAQLRATTNAANRANVQVFPVDARGLVASPPLGDASQRSPGGAGMFSGTLAQAAISRFQRSQDTLYALARDTGGRPLVDDNDLARGIVAAARAQTSYYIIGYYSTHTAKDGRFRSVRITLARDLQAELSHRQGYYADKTFARMSGAERERQLEEALRLENPVTDVTIALELHYFQLNSAEYFVPVAAKIPGSELALARRRGAPRMTLDVITEVKDSYGLTMQNMRDRLDIRLSDLTAAQLASQPIQYETGFTLLPGAYVMKLLVRDAEAGRIGTYETPFTIPNLNKEQERLPISTVVLGSQQVRVGDELYSVKSNAAQSVGHPLVHDGRKLLPSVTRVFNASDDLYVYLQAYERYTETMQPLAAFVSFYQGDLKVYESAPVAIVDAPQGRAKAVPIRLRVPLAGLPAGRYDCQVTVLEPAGRKIAFWQAPIAIVR